MLARTGANEQWSINDLIKLYWELTTVKQHLGTIYSNIVLKCHSVRRLVVAHKRVTVNAIG